MKFKKSNPPQFYFLAGAEDTVVPAEAIRETADEMKQKGYSVKFETVRGIGHDYSDELTAKVSDWFDSLPSKIIE
jgi:predicted esterase